MELQVGDRCRINENFNSLKAGQLMEVIKLNANGTFQCIDIYTYGKHTLELSQIEIEE